MKTFYTIYKVEGTKAFDPADSYGFAPFWEREEDLNGNPVIFNDIDNEVFGGLGEWQEIARFADQREAEEYLDKFRNSFKFLERNSNGDFIWEYKIYIYEEIIFDNDNNVYDHSLQEYCQQYELNIDYSIDVNSTNDKLAGAFLNCLEYNFEDYTREKKDVDFREVALFLELKRIVNNEASTISTRMNILFSKARIKARIDHSFLECLDNGCVDYHDIMSISEWFKN